MFIARARKFRNIPTTLGGHSFASKVEARRYGELLLLEKAGAVSNIKVHPRFPLIVNGIDMGNYEADFSYLEKSALVVEDVKSPATKTPLYRLKKKLMKALHHINVVEVEYK